MGSLLPGWDAASSVPPKDLQEFNETEQPVGYFAKLEHTKSLKRTSVDTYHAGASQPMLQPIPSLQRASSLHQGTAVPMPSSVAHAPTQRHPLSSSLGTSSIMMHHPSTSPRAFKPTDWESEFKSLGSSKRTSVGPFARTSGEQADSGRSSAEHHATTATAQPHWWAHMDSGLLNRGEGADAEAAAVGSTAMKDLRGSFKLDVPTAINLH